MRRLRRLRHPGGDQAGAGGAGSPSPRGHVGLRHRLWLEAAALHAAPTATTRSTGGRCRWRRGSSWPTTRLNVIAVTGDGDGYGIGQGHFIHAMRRNADITHIVENNQVYGLTKGQYSPTSERGYISTFSPEGAIEFAINPIALALGRRRDVHRAGLRRRYQADERRAPGGDPPQGLRPGRRAPAVRHLQQAQHLRLVPLACTTSSTRSPATTWTTASRPGRRPSEWGDRIPVGIFYVENERPSYEEQVGV